MNKKCPYCHVIARACYCLPRIQHYFAEAAPLTGAWKFLVWWCGPLRIPQYRLQELCRRGELKAYKDTLHSEHPRWRIYWSDVRDFCARTGRPQPRPTLNELLNSLKD